MGHHARTLGFRPLAGWVVAFTIGLAAALVRTPPAVASETYPGVIEDKYGIDCPRPLTRCLICHTTAAGGEGTANRPFAVTLRDYGLTEGKSGRVLGMALDTLDPEQDSDDDGVPDEEELALCMNPSGPELSDGPGFGCAPRLAPRVGSGMERWAATLSLVLLFALSRRRDHSGGR